MSNDFLYSFFISDYFYKKILLKVEIICIIKIIRLTKEKYKKWQKLKPLWLYTHTHTHTDSLSEIKIDTSRDRKNLLFCGMQN